MRRQDDPQRKSRRDLLLILLFLPFGVLCMFMAGQIAIRLAPNWALPANLLSNLDPNTNFSGLGNRVLIEPINPGILTQPVWNGLFLTPNASIPTREVVEVFTPVLVITPPPEIETPVKQPSPTPTATLGGIIIPPPPGSLIADLSVTKTDSSNTYTPGTTVSYTIVVTNGGPDATEGFHIEDNVSTKITGLNVNCSASSGASCGVNASSGNTISFRRAAVKVGDQIAITVSGLVSSGATGNLSNTVSIHVPSDAPFNDLDKSNNSATDTDTRLAISDLVITKSDASNTYAATGPITYRIVVTNNGPSDAFGVRVVDDIPPQIESWTWTCSMTNATGCDGVVGSTSSFADSEINIQVGGMVEYTVTANLPTNAYTDTSSITNTASLPIRPSFTDPNPSNNAATDTDIPYIDLQITKDDRGAAFAPNGTVRYTITVTNNSTFDVTGIGISDPKPVQFTSWSWMCGTANPSCDEVTNSNGDFTDTIDLPALSSLVYNVRATVSRNPGFDDITNTATLSVPAGLVDANLTNNSATETTPPAIDLQVTKTDGVVSYTRGGTLRYTVIVTNNSEFDLTGVTVTDIMPVLLNSWSWTCTSDPGSSCAAGSNTTNINDTVNLLAHGTVTYVIDAVINDFAAGTLENTASVAPPVGIVDVDMSNNTAIDSDVSTAGEPDIGPPDGIVMFPAEGTTTTYVISPTITSDGSNTPDFVYYEQATSTGISMDVVIVELSKDGGTWVPVFNWGNGLDDTNTNVSLSIIGYGDDPLDPEYDGRGIADAYLYNHTGIAIDIDSLGLSGSYPWIRFYCPTSAEGNLDGSCDIDAIQPYYP